MGAPLKILLTEDVPANVALYRVLLEKSGHSVDAAADGETAVSLAAAHAYDVVLMDLGLPGINGVEAARRIRAGGGPSAQAPVIALSADDEPHLRRACEAVGMTGYLVKPLSPVALLAALAKMATPAA